MESSGSFYSRTILYSILPLLMHHAECYCYRDMGRVVESGLVSKIVECIVLFKKRKKKRKNNTFSLYTQALKPIYPKNIANVHFHPIWKPLCIWYISVEYFFVAVNFCFSIVYVHRCDGKCVGSWDRLYVIGWD